MTSINLNNLFMDRKAESRSISAENPTGAPGQGAKAIPDENDKFDPGWPARELGEGWKVRPYINIKAGETATIMDTEGPGVIRHIWLTYDPEYDRNLVIRIYWDGESSPSVVAPLGDFFCNAWEGAQNIISEPINVNPRGGKNCYFPMPFKQHARVTVTNDSTRDLRGFYYTINYTLEQVPEDALYFHAWWRRTNPLTIGEEYVLVDRIKGRGQYVGTFMAWQQNNAGWWGEGEIKMFIDGDNEYPTICGTGTEDYFGGAWCFVEKRTGPAGSKLNAETSVTGEYSAPYLGFQVVEGENLAAGARMTLYRFHTLDPVFFKKDLKVTMQALGWRSHRRFLQLQDDISSVTYWYQTIPHAPFPEIQGLQEREVI